MARLHHNAKVFMGFLAGLLIFSQPAGAIPAFRGAEGFGANSIGGRGGTVIKVTNLNDSGPGSFRAAVTASGPRIVVFAVSGIINLQSNLNITEPYLTIAGQTSPGGILVTGYQTTLNAHNVIIQHMRFRVGSHRIADGADPETLDAFDIWGNAQGHMPTDAHDIIIDHCSFSWGVDENFSFAYNPRDITVQWCIIAEGLSHAGHPKGEHSKGMLVWGKYSPNLTLSLHHNYFAHNTARNPMINGPNGDQPLVDAVNNVAYDWYGGAVMGSQDMPKVNWKENYAKKGPSSNQNCYEVYYDVSNVTVGPQPMCYVKGNFGLTRLNQSDDEWCVAIGWQFVKQDTAWRKMTPWATPYVTTATMSHEIAQRILTAVGATAPVRDSIDTRDVNSFFSGTGAIIDNVTYPDDFPTLQPISAPNDQDNDGMADNWEEANGLNPSVNDSAGDKDGDGYTNIEEYLFYLSSESFPFIGTCMPGDVATSAGDVNGDGQIDLEDVILALRVVSGQASGLPLKLDADVDGDGKIGLSEAVFDLERVSGARSE